VAEGRIAMMAARCDSAGGGLPLIKDGQFVGAIGVSACNRSRTAWLQGRAPPSCDEPFSY